MLSFRKVALTLLGVALTLVLLDPLAGIVAARYFPEYPALLPDPSNAHGLDVFWSMVGQGQKPVVFTGSSTTIEGVSPHIFDDTVRKLSGQAVLSVNVGVTGQVSIWADELARDIFIPGGASTIFYMTEMRAFASQGGEKYWQESPLGSTLNMEPGWRKSAALWLLQHSTFVRYRQNAYDILTGNRPVGLLAGSYGSLDDRSYASIIGLQDPAKPIPVPNDWTPLRIDPPYRAALLDFAAICQTSHTRCVFVQMPVHATLYRAMLPADRVAFRALLQQAANSGDGFVSVWDFNTQACVDALRGAAFKDWDHLNVDGAREFSGILASLYAAQFAGTTLATDSGAACAVRS